MVVVEEEEEEKECGSITKRKKCEIDRAIQQMDRRDRGPWKAHMHL